MIDVTGAFGGLFAAAWGAGAVSGYAFAARTIGRQVAQLRIDMAADKADCNLRITDLTNRLRTVEDRGYNGMSRQAEQVRDSTTHLIDRGVIRPPLGDSA